MHQLFQELFFNFDELIKNLSNKRSALPLLKKKPITHKSFRNFQPNDGLSVKYTTEDGNIIIIKGVVLKGKNSKLSQRISFIACIRLYKF